MQAGLLLQTGSMRGRGIGETLLHIVQQEGPQGLFRYVLAYVSMCPLHILGHICRAPTLIYFILLNITCAALSQISGMLNTAWSSSQLCTRCAGGTAPASCA